MRVIWEQHCGSDPVHWFRLEVRESDSRPAQVTLRLGEQHGCDETASWRAYAMAWSDARDLALAILKADDVRKRQQRLQTEQLPLRVAPVPYDPFHSADDAPGDQAT